VPGLERAPSDALPEEHDGARRVVLPRHPRQSLRLRALTVQRHGPFAGRRILVLLRVDELFARHAELAQRDAGQVDELQIRFDPEGGMDLASELGLVEALKSSGMWDVVKDGLHQRAW